MNFFKKLAVGASIAIAMGAANATLVLPGPEQSLQSIINGLYTATGSNPGAVGAPNVNANQYGLDEMWQLEASQTTAATFIIEISGNSNNNTFGIYNLSDPSKQVTLFGGPADGADRATVTIFGNGGGFVSYIALDGGGLPTGVPTIVSFGAGTLSGTTFGYFLGTSPTNTFFSQSHLNGGNDQMVAYQGDGDTIQLPGGSNGVWGSSSFILAWEDTLYSNSDKDFNDMVVYVESVTGIPEPATLALVGLSLAGLGFASRRRKA